MKFNVLINPHYMREGSHSPDCGHQARPHPLSLEGTVFLILVNVTSFLKCEVSFSLDKPRLNNNPFLYA